MRTTVTLDHDVEAKLRAFMREHDMSFKEALNSAVRAGLRLSPPPASSFEQVTFGMGFRPELALDKALALASRLDDEEIARKLILQRHFSSGCSRVQGMRSPAGVWKTAPSVLGALRTI